MTDSAIFARHLELAERSEHEPLFKSGPALIVIDDALVLGFATIGLDGFDLLEGCSIRPRLDVIMDLSNSRVDSWQLTCEQCRTAADRFLEMMSDEPELVYAIVLISEDEWLIR